MTSARVVHFEIPFDDGDRARDFYKQVFDWSLQPMPEFDYTGISTGPAGEDGMPSEPGYIGGGMSKRDGPYSHPVVVMAVDDIDETMKVIEKHGGSQAIPKMAVGEMGFAAYFNDPEGNVLGLWQNAS
jgi:uncharacterized protein